MRTTPLFSVTTPSRKRACASSSSPARPDLVSSNGSFDSSATPLKVFWPWVTTLYPSASISRRGNASSTHLISCRQTISGEHSFSQLTRCSIRCRIELTFHVAMRMQMTGLKPHYFTLVAYHVGSACANSLRETRRNNCRRGSYEPSRSFREGAVHV